MIQKIRILAMLLLACGRAAFAQQEESASPTMVFAGATIHIGNGQVIENGIMGVSGGKIAFIGDAQSTQYDQRRYRVIDCSGKDIYPGLIAPNTQLGLIEISAVRATNDTYEIGEFNPEIRSIIAYNTDSRVIPTVRSNGILLAQIVPYGSVLSGTSSVVKLDGWNWEDAAYAMDNCMHMEWPPVYHYDYKARALAPNPDYDAEVQRIRDFFDQAKAYCAVQDHAEKNLRFEAMRKVFTGNMRLFIEAGEVKEIAGAVQFARDYDIHIVIVGGDESYKIAHLLHENQIPVLIEQVHRLPDRTDDDVNLPYKLPFLLQQAGVEFGISFSGDGDSYWNMRNLPFIAGTAAAFGLTKEQALTAITLSNAKLLGIDSSAGSLEQGKDATFLISDGDLLDMRSSILQAAYIQGKEIDLNNWQHDLYEKYSNKYGIEVK